MTSSDSMLSSELEEGHTMNLELEIMMEAVERVKEELKRGRV